MTKEARGGRGDLSNDSTPRPLLFPRPPSRKRDRMHLILVQLVYIRMARFDGEVRFIAIRVLMQPRSSLVNRQLFNKYFHSHHYYLGKRAQRSRERLAGGEGEARRGRETDTITRISTSVRIHISTLYTRDSCVVPVLFSFFFSF